MKKYGITALVLSGCRAEHTLTPYEIGNMQGELIIKCIQEQNQEPIMELFCRKTKETHPDLDQEIEDFFAFIDGEIISYDEPYGNIGGATRDGRVIEQSITGDIYNIKTDQGKTYYIEFLSYSAYEKDESYVGMSVIGIVDVDSYDKGRGYGSSVQIGDEL